MKKGGVYWGQGRLTRRMAGARGFTLTEIAIVIGVVGILVGGIFLAASAASYRIRFNQGVDEISLIVGNMRSLYASQNASAVAAKSFAVATPILISQDVFPQEMLVAGVTTVADNPWDRTAAGGSAQIQLVAPAGGNPAEFTVRYLNVPADVCVDLLVHTSLPGADTGLVEIAVGATLFTSAANKLPVPPVLAAAACPVGGTYTVDFYYTLGS